MTAKSNTPASNLSIVAQPGNQGQTLIDLIASAQTSIDIVIYEINDPAIVSALITAMSEKNVTVRAVMDVSSDTTSQTNLGFVAAMISAMISATENGQPTPIPAARFSPHWASRNFNITHQKTVIVDAVDANGNPVSPLPDTARLLISTGNFSGYEKQPFYAATDFYVTTAMPTLIAQASAVFNSDFNRDGPTVNNANFGTQSVNGPLIWSNGSWASPQTNQRGWPVDQYPAVSGYPYPLPNPTTFTNEGNVAGYLLALVQSAQPGDVLRIYNEEFSSDGGENPVYQALIVAANKGVEVRVMMSYNTSYADDQASCARAGGTITLLAPQAYLQAIAGYEGPTYIHAKAFLLSQAGGTFLQGWVGSTNLGNSSLFANRELGIALDSGDADEASVIVSQFDSDTAWFQKSNPSCIYAVQWTKSNAGSYGHPKVPAAWPTPAPSPSVHVKQACGSLAASECTPS